MSKESKRKAKRHKKDKPPKAREPYYTDTSQTRLYDDGWERRVPAPPRPPLDVAALKDAISRNLDLNAFGLEMRRPPGTSGVGLYLGSDRVGEVEEDRARVGRHLPMADFMADDGEHWEHLRGYLAEAIANESPIASAPTIRSGEVLTAFPADIADDVREQVSSATAAIKTGFRDYGIRHVLDALAYTLTFWQTSKIDGIMGVPFEFAPAGGNAVGGVLCILRRDNDPLPILVSSDIDRAEVQRAWITAISDFAQLLTHPEHQPDHAPGEEADRRLRAVGTRVAGYKRRLPAEQHASDLQRDRTAAVGVTLAPEGETWVSEYVVNGQDDSGIDAPVRITWTSAVELERLVREAA